MAKFNKLKACVYMMVAVCLMLTWYAIVDASTAIATPPVDSVSSKDIIMILFGLLQTVFMGIGVWLISNDKELFTRMGKVESAQATSDALCKERNEGEHYHKRASDTDTTVALKESIDMLRRALHSMLDKGDSL